MGPIRAKAKDHSLIQSVDRVLRALKGGMDKQPGTRNVNDLLQVSVLRTEDTMAINRRQKNDRELAPFVRIDIHFGKHRAQRIVDPFDSQKPTPFHAPDVLDGAVARAEDFRRAGGDGTIRRFHASSEQGVE